MKAAYVVGVQQEKQGDVIRYPLPAVKLIRQTQEQKE